MVDGLAWGFMCPSQRVRGGGDNEVVVYVAVMPAYRENCLVLTYHIRQGVVQGMGC